MGRLDPIEWRVWWLKDEPLKGAILLMVMILVPLFIFGAMPESPGFAVLGFLIMLFSFWQLLVPTVYRITRDSVRWRSFVFSGTYPLQKVKRIVQGASGFWLSPLEKESILDDFRGIWLRLPRADGRVREQVNHRLKTLFEAAEEP